MSMLGDIGRGARRGAVSALRSAGNIATGIASMMVTSGRFFWKVTRATYDLLGDELFPLGDAAQKSTFETLFFENFWGTSIVGLIVIVPVGLAPILFGFIVHGVKSCIQNFKDIVDVTLPAEKEFKSKEPPQTFWPKALGFVLGVFGYIPGLFVGVGVVFVRVVANTWDTLKVVAARMTNVAIEK